MPRIANDLARQFTVPRVFRGRQRVRDLDPGQSHLSTAGCELHVVAFRWRGTDFPSRARLDLPQAFVVVPTPARGPRRSLGLDFSVGAALSKEQSNLALDYFTEDVGRALCFGGAPVLTAAMATLQQVAERCGDTAAAIHAGVALSSPLLRAYKRIEPGPAGERLAVRTSPAEIDVALKAQTSMLLQTPSHAATTLGHIAYFGALDRLASSLHTSGADREARKVLKACVTTMKERAVLASVIQAAEHRLTSLG
jgi:hypothetical protein